MIRDNAKVFMQRLDFDINSQKELLLSFDKLLEYDDFLSIIRRYDSIDFNFDNEIENVKIIAQQKNIDPFTAYMLLFVCMAPKLHKKYVEKGIDDKIFYNTMADLKYKLEECRLVHNKCGTFVPAWYKGFFEMRIYALGRLQFEINHTWFDCEINGIKIQKGAKVLSVHIPRTGTKLSHDLVRDSYAQAKEFFKDEFNDHIIFICNSWLLYPWNRTVFRENSNLANFYDDFTIVSTGEYKNYDELWRLFDCIYDGDPNHLPSDTSLRRAYITRVKSGEPIGHGTGVIIMNK